MNFHDGHDANGDLGAVWWRWMMFLLDCDESQHDDGRTPAFPCCTFHLFSGWMEARIMTVFCEEFPISLKHAYSLAGLVYYVVFVLNTSFKMRIESFINFGPILQSWGDFIYFFEVWCTIGQTHFPYCKLSINRTSNILALFSYKSFENSKAWIDFVMNLWIFSWKV